MFESGCYPTDERQKRHADAGPVKVERKWPQSTRRQVLIPSAFLYSR